MSLFTPKLKKDLISLLLVLLIMAAGVSVVFAGTLLLCRGAHTQDCYKAPGTNNGSAIVEVTEYGDDLCVQNGNPPDLLVPTNTSGEWTKFKSVTASTTIASSIHVALKACSSGGSSCGLGASGFGVSNGTSVRPGTKANATGAAVQDLRNHINASGLSSSTKQEFLSKTASITWASNYGFLTSTISTTKGNITSETYLENAYGGAGGASQPGYDAEVDWTYPANVCN